jgi:hypothetical protein
VSRRDGGEGVAQEKISLSLPYPSVSKLTAPLAYGGSFEIVFLYWVNCYIIAFFCSAKKKGNNQNLQEPILSCIFAENRERCGINRGA